MNKYKLKDFIGNDPLAQIYYEREMEWRKLLNEGKTREEIETYMATTDYEERIEKIIYPNGKKKKEVEYEIGDKDAVFDLLGLCRPSINGKAKYCRILIKRLGWRYFKGYEIGEDGKKYELWEYEFDNATEEELQNFLKKNTIYNGDEKLR